MTGRCGFKLYGVGRFKVVSILARSRDRALPTETVDRYGDIMVSILARSRDRALLLVAIQRAWVKVVSILARSRDRALQRRNDNR